MLKLNFKHTIAAFFVLISTFCFSQKNIETVLEDFSAYTSKPRELVYSHLNKSTYVKGESLGFTSYVFDKNAKAPSVITKNLYCVVLDTNKKVIAEKLIKVDNGSASNIFEIDSTYTSGEYQFKAYTNYMRNFDEPNYFVQNFKVIDPEKEKEINPKAVANQLDLQVLPEGGQALENIFNTFGIIVKNQFGYGVANLTGQVIDDQNNQVSAFKLNDIGIGRVRFIPLTNRTYTVVLDAENNTASKIISDIKTTGLHLSVNALAKGVAISVETNKVSLKNIKSENYTLTIHNGKDILSIPVSFKKELVIVKKLSDTNLFKGINVITLFDSNNNPLLERLVFNYNGVTTKKTEVVNVTKSYDSVSVSLNYKALTPSVFNNLSVSVLPEGTKSYKHNHSMISYLYLKPYVKGIIENGGYYFNSISNKTKFELDNLLLTQGWSRYDWYNLKNDNQKGYVFENGITALADINTEEEGDYFVYPLINNNSQLFKLTKKDTAFHYTGLYPLNEEKLRIGHIKKTGKSYKPKVFLRYAPFKIPYYKTEDAFLPLEAETFTDDNSNNYSFKVSEKSEQLEEVVLTGNKKTTKVEKLRNKHVIGNIDVFNDGMRGSNLTLLAYLSTKGFTAEQTGFTVTILNRNPTFHNNPTPQVYLNDALVLNLDSLFNFRMDQVDYVLIDKQGLDQGIRSGGGVIKIYTDPKFLLVASKSSNFGEYSFPLTFSTQKTYYAPQYQYYDTAFFKEFGTINWLPNVTIKNNNTASFKFLNTNTKVVNLYIEGVNEKGDLFSEIKTIEVK